MIKDTGNRTPMGDTGFVRDCHDGKGRFDLLPWHAIHDVAKHCEEGAKKYGERNIDKGAPQHSLIDSGIRHLVRYINCETDEPHLRAAAWNILWALEQDTTHPELNDLPNRGKTILECRHDGVLLPCYMCAHRSNDPHDSESPCYICRHNVSGEPLDHPCLFERSSSFAENFRHETEDDALISCLDAECGKYKTCDECPVNCAFDECIEQDWENMSPVERRFVYYMLTGHSWGGEIEK